MTNFRCEKLEIILFYFVIALLQRLKAFWRELFHVGAATIHITY